MINQTIQKLKQVKGLANFYLLTKEDRAKILELEEPRNLGIRECLKKKFVLAMSHTSEFRKPAGEIVKDGIFPPVPFQEVKGAISSSPGWKVHEFLKKKLKLKDEASLIVGSDT